MKAFLGTNGQWEFDGSPQDIAEVKTWLEARAACGGVLTVKPEEFYPSCANCKYCVDTLTGSECSEYEGLLCGTARSIAKYCGANGKSFEAKEEAK